MGEDGFEPPSDVKRRFAYVLLTALKLLSLVNPVNLAADREKPFNNEKRLRPHGF